MSVLVEYVSAQQVSVVTPVPASGRGGIAYPGDWIVVEVGGRVSIIDPVTFTQSYAQLGAGQGAVAKGLLVPVASGTVNGTATAIAAPGIVPASVILVTVVPVAGNIPANLRGVYVYSVGTGTWSYIVLTTDLAVLNGATTFNWVAF